VRVQTRPSAPHLKVANRYVSAFPLAEDFGAARMHIPPVYTAEKQWEVYLDVPIQHCADGQCADGQAPEGGRSGERGIHMDRIRKDAVMHFDKTVGVGGAYGVVLKCIGNCIRRCQTRKTCEVCRALYSPMEDKQGGLC